MMSNEKDTTNVPRYKGRLHLVELYLDDPEWQDAYNRLLDFENVAYIHHNKDDCKEHVHAIIKTNNPTWNTSICKKLGIEVKWCEQIKNFKSSLRYLIHADNTDKHQYDEKEVMFTSTNMQEEFLKAIDDTPKLTEEEKVVGILDLLDSIDDYISYTAFVRLTCQNGYYDALRRANYLMSKILEEHNKKYVSRKTMEV